MKCPDCGNIVKEHQTTCICGWSRIEETNKTQCAYREGFKQCPEEGTLSNNIRGGGPWYCAKHFWNQ